MLKNIDIFEKYLQRISSILMINGSLLPNLSIEGKMGVSIFFCHYARHTGNPIFSDHAFDLIEEIQQQIHLDSPVNYQSGLAGIGAGIEYLAQNLFLDVDTDEILEDFDQRIIQDILCRSHNDFSLQTGITGLCRYFLFRIKNPSSGKKLKSVANKCFSCYLNLLTGSKILEQKDTIIPFYDILSILCDLYPLQELNKKADHCIHQICDHFFDDISGKDLPYLIPVLYKLSTFSPYLSLSDADSRMEQILQSPDPYFSKKKSIFGITEIEFWIWLLRCKRQNHCPALMQQLAKKEEKIQNMVISKFEIPYKEGDNLGIQGGITGLGLSLLSTIDPDSSSWLSLL